MFMGNEKNLVPVTPGILSPADSKIMTYSGIVIRCAFLPGVPRRD
jgi:hypothetical protein